MADERHPPDTLFLVAEEDWRCYKDDDHGVEGVDRSMLADLAESSAEVPASVGEAIQARKRQNACTEPAGERSWGSKHERV